MSYGQPKYRERLAEAERSFNLTGATIGARPNNLRQHLNSLAERGEPYKGRWRGLDRARVEMILEERITPMPSEAHTIAHLTGTTVAELFPHLDARPEPTEEGGAGMSAKSPRAVYNALTPLQTHVLCRLGGSDSVTPWTIQGSRLKWSLNSIRACLLRLETLGLCRRNDERDEQGDHSYAITSWGDMVFRARIPAAPKPPQSL